MSSICTDVNDVNDLTKFIPIIFQGGSYGSFLIFCLTNLNTKDFSNPLCNNTGNSHNFEKNDLYFRDKYITRIRNDTQWLKYHPIETKDQSLKEEVNRLADITKRGIFIYPSRNHYLLALNNQFDKVYHQQLGDELIGNDTNERSKFFNNLYNGWGIDPSVSVNDIKRWIKREFLSFYIFAAFEDEHEWYLLDSYKNENLLIITTRDLLYDFENCIKKCALYCGIDTIDNLDELVEMQKQQLSLQKHLNKDEIVNNVIDCFLNDKQAEIPELSLIDEAYIQHILRNEGYELHCNNMNEFPKDINSLKEKTSKV